MLLLLSTTAYHYVYGQNYTKITQPHINGLHFYENGSGTIDVTLDVGKNQTVHVLHNAIPPAFVYNETGIFFANNGSTVSRDSLLSHITNITQVVGN
jgi:hypothetical protein